ncbi:serine protein kinase RIO [Nonomuraea sp. NPDC050556]|uniref:serine protein kinase RIO n=1 Tax=Nonomuraea sp. NPDC050556 TaxID=3364369 RepID=UPI0037ABF69D
MEITTVPKRQSAFRTRGKNALDADDLEWLDSAPTVEELEGPPSGDRWSTWDQSTPTERGPKPHPRWLVTELAAVDTELGILKTGKEADVHLISRGVPDTDRVCLLAAKRYRAGEHRLFHRDSGYLEGRQTRESRMNRAMAKRTAFGKQVIAAQWAVAEFDALCRLWKMGLPVPYPVQIVGTEILEEFVGTPDGYAAPRLAAVSDGLESLWEQLVDAMVTLARQGLAHGDLSPYNILVQDGRLVIIDLPQIVDVIAHPTGFDFLDRDARNVATWFAGKGLAAADPDGLAALLRAEAGAG